MEQRDYTTLHVYYEGQDSPATYVDYLNLAMVRRNFRVSDSYYEHFNHECPAFHLLSEKLDKLSTRRLRQVVKTCALIDGIESSSSLLKLWDKASEVLWLRENDSLL